MYEQGLLAENDPYKTYTDFAPTTKPASNALSAINEYNTMVQPAKTPVGLLENPYVAMNHNWSVKPTDIPYKSEWERKPPVSTRVPRKAQGKFSLGENPFGLDDSMFGLDEETQNKTKEGINSLSPEDKARLESAINTYIEYSGEGESGGDYFGEESEKAPDSLERDYNPSYTLDIDYMGIGKKAAITSGLQSLQSLTKGVPPQAAFLGFVLSTALSFGVNVAVEKVKNEIKMAEVRKLHREHSIPGAPPGTLDADMDVSIDRASSISTAMKQSDAQAEENDVQAGYGNMTGYGGFGGLGIGNPGSYGHPGGSVDAPGFGGGYGEGATSTSEAMSQSDAQAAENNTQGAAPGGANSYGGFGGGYGAASEGGGDGDSGQGHGGGDGSDNDSGHGGGSGQSGGYGGDSGYGGGDGTDNDSGHGGGW